MSYVEKHSGLLMIVLLAIAAPLSGTVGQLTASAEAVSARNSSQSAADIFSMPKSLAKGTTVRINGEASLQTISNRLKDGFETRFPETRVQVSSSTSAQALQNLSIGKTDLVILARPLTATEQQTGLTAIPITRDKIAIMTGKENPFHGSLTNEQFAKIFSGEITNWSDIGGPIRPIHLLNRKSTSDLHQSLTHYPVFRGKNLTYGEVLGDNLEPIIRKLGDDGIAFAPADQVMNRGDVNLISLHQVSPADSRYSFSQPYSYIYQGPTPSPQVRAFLGYSLAPEQSATIDAGRLQSLGIAPSQTPNALKSEPSNAAIPSTTTASQPRTSNSAPIGSSSSQGNRPSQEASSLTPVKNPNSTPTGYHWWWLLLPALSLPLLALLFIGKKQGRASRLYPQGNASDMVGVAGATGGASPKGAGGIPAPFSAGETSRLVLVIQNCREVKAFWELNSADRHRLTDSPTADLKVRLFDVTVQSETNSHFQEFLCDRHQPECLIPISVDNRSYTAQLGFNNLQGQWQTLASANPIAVPACNTDVSTGHPHQSAARPTISSPQSWIQFIPHNSHQGEVTWHLSPEHCKQLQDDGNGALILRVHDAHHLNLEREAAHQTFEFSVNPTDQAKLVNLPMGDRDYVAELGYHLFDSNNGSLTSQPHWISLIRSGHSHFPKADQDGSRVVMMPCDPYHLSLSSEQMNDQPKAYLYWDIDPLHKAVARSEGGNVLVLRLYTQQKKAHPPFNQVGPSIYQQIAEYIIQEEDRDRVLSLPEDGCYYQAEVGYVTLQRQFLSLGKSIPVFIAASHLKQI